MNNETTIYDLQTVQGKNVILPAKVSKCGNFATLFLPCPYCGQKHRHEITASEFEFIMKYNKGIRSFYQENQQGEGVYVVSGISPKDAGCRSWAKVLQTINFIKFWEAMEDCFHDEEND